MRALTLTQPWATLVAQGAKRIETRSWTTDYRGPLAIHAAKGLGPVEGISGLDTLCAASPFYDALWPIIGVEEHLYDVQRLPRGAIVAVAELVDCRCTGDDVREYGAHLPEYDQIWMLTDQERAFGDYSPGRYAWLLADVRRLPTPVPCRGALGLWDVPANIEAQLLTQLEV